ncbi:NmrA family NAD(P)-binding protein [Streptomyces sparsogenes]|uniref:NmrA family protein n=1 Tax=Streptomyces sparsogenes DSM 40356 TaxID=1331668 RepID=A0A1R1SDA7_9ACTN|nr:NmrA family NAD(P)-binding protein [Streptomyces sparsogenes]OMI36280.1 NmrA family protein [Streptomyces sparsogenes DSM 40356]
MSQAPILVLGGRGKTGRRVVARLRDLDLPVRAASRSTATLFDYGDPATWGPALEGVRAVYLVPMVEFVDLADVTAFIRRAAREGVERIVLLSARGEGGGAHPDQEPLETLVREAVPRWTILRAGWFAQNFSEDFLLEPVMSGELALPAGEGREAFVDVADIADVAVAALTGDAHAGQVYEVTGPEALSFRTVAALISEASGREVRYTPVDRDTYVAALSGQGYPDDTVRAVADLMEAIGRGAGETVGDGVRRALGRPPRSFADFVKEAAASGAWTAGSD